VQRRRPRPAAVREPRLPEPRDERGQHRPDHRGEGRILNNLGYLAKYLGQPEQARHYYEQALAILQEIGEVDTTRVVTDNLTSLDAAATAFAEAHDTSAIPQEKAPSPKRRRWPWQRKRTY